MINNIHSILNFINQKVGYPDLRIVESTPTPETIVDGKKVLMFTSNNYLGLSEHPKIVEAAIQAARTYGVGSDGSRLLSGNLKIHREFEKAIANFKGGDDAIVWPSGYAANVGTISAIAKPIRFKASHFFEPRAVIFSDSLNHASIIDGIKLSSQKKVIYNHCDVDDLVKKMKRYPFRRKLVVTDSVFSMDGDIAPLDKIAEVCKKYKAALMIDEAHSTGVLGEKGHGSLEYFGLKAKKDVDIVLGTCSKSLASTGGFVVAEQGIVDYLRVASRSYMFSTAMSPFSSAALLKSLEIIDSEPERREKLWSNTNYLREKLNESGFDTLNSKTQIIPILIGEDAKAIEFSRKLFEHNIYAPAVRWPAVRKGKAIIRITIMATHTREHLDFFLKACKKIKKEIL